MEFLLDFLNLDGIDSDLLSFLLVKDWDEPIDGVSIVYFGTNKNYRSICKLLIQLIETFNTNKRFRAVRMVFEKK